MQFNHSKFNLHVQIHRKELETEQPTVRLSLEDIAESLGVHKSILIRAMHGKTKPNKKNLTKIAHGMNHEPSEYIIEEID